MNLSFLFPGQGSQKVGMGKDIFEQSDFAKKRFEEANDILERNIKNIIFDGTEEVLKQTENTQPAMFLIESVIADLLKQNGIFPSFTLGHSLGEYSALYASEVFDFATGIDLVAKRGELMAEAGKRYKGAMAAILGMEKEKIISYLLEIKNGVVVSANENSPEQTVISGDSAAVESACEILKANGAKRAVALAVSGAFHSPLMKDAADEFSKYLEDKKFNDAKYPVITNVRAKPEKSADTIKSLLVEQLLSPVRWVDCQNELFDVGVRNAVEVGPGNVLKGLMKKTVAEIEVVNCADWENVISIMETYKTEEKK
ncbi:MAG: ACP S-malonyltransferase [Chitinispirillales bacterium]|jgi:[acyl-carrier-protein] S-malonyltransferase|nr:ACP S-malonyltransferase [Chitinispirillales bacterium]